MTRSLLPLFFLSIGLIGKARAECDDGWYPAYNSETGDDICFFVSKFNGGKADYTGSVAACEEMSATLLPFSHLKTVWEATQAMDPSPLTSTYRMEGVSYGYGKWYDHDGNLGCQIFPDDLVNYKRGFYGWASSTIKINRAKNKLLATKASVKLNYICVKEVCASDRYYCADGSGCFPASWECDVIVDCDDGSDEENCPTTEPFVCPTYSCDDGATCIPDNWECDYIVDCYDGADEENCPTTAGPSTPDPSICLTFSCDGGDTCIPNEWTCDAETDCTDGADESLENCPTLASDCTDPGSFLCDSDYTCLDGDRVCDGIPNCVDGTDEEGCDSHACPTDGSTYHQCTAGNCIPDGNVCDGVYDCPDFDDEADGCTPAAGESQKKIIGKPGPTTQKPRIIVDPPVIHV